MRIPVKAVLHSPAETLTVGTSLELSGLKEKVKQLVRLSPVDVKAKIAQQGGMYHLSGDVDLDTILRCSRCLRDAPVHLHAELDEVLADAPLTEEMEEGEVIPIEDHKIDLIPIVESAILLALPIVPLCDEACKGLCPKCGANLNEADCGCTVDALDPRLAKLQEFFANKGT